MTQEFQINFINVVKTEEEIQNLGFSTDGPVDFPSFNVVRFGV